MKTEGELFRKIVIKTAEDLPSEISIKYFVMFKDGTYCKDKRLNPLDRTNMQVWTSFVDWYLQPVSQEQKHETAEIKSAEVWFFERYPKEAEGVGTVLLFEIMREYADYVSQFQKKMSDDKWDKLNKEFDDLINNLSDEDWINWHNQLDVQKKSIRLDLLLKSKIQRDKLNK